MAFSLNSYPITYRAKFTDQGWSEEYLEKHHKTITEEAALSEADREALARNPLPPGELNLVDFCVNGHRISYQGALTVAFRMGSDGGLEAFAGHECRGITIDGKEQVLADGKLALLAWAPVPAARRVSGGAILELWAHAGAATNVTVPLPGGMSGGRLFLAGSRPGSLDRAVESVCENGRLRFVARPEWPRPHLYLLPG